MKRISTLFCLGVMTIWAWSFPVAAVGQSDVNNEGCGSCGGRSSASNLPAFGADTNLQDAIAQKLEISDKVKIELFVMSQCPFAVRAEKAIAPILEQFGEQTDFKLYFIAREAPDGGFRSMHGQTEVEEDIRQVVMAKYYPDKYFDYIVARADNYRSDEWEQLAADLGMDPEIVNEIAYSAEGEELFRENIKKANELGIGASPTLLIDDRKYMGRILPLSAASAGAGTDPETDAGGALATVRPGRAMRIVNDNQCETDPSQCQCSVVTCANACSGFSIPHDCEHYCLECALGDALKCVACVACVGFEIGGWLDCAIICEAGPCQYGYQCGPPCSSILDAEGHPVYVCSGYTREAEFCSCDGQSSYWSEVACPSGESCCYNSAGDVVCVDLQSDIYNCGECRKECWGGGTPYCVDGECVECLTAADCVIEYGSPEEGKWHECNNGSCDLNLPVELTSFTATAGDGKVTLHWVTESEVDNLGFDIYRSLSKDGEYERITHHLIEGAGSSSSQHEYTYTDQRLRNGVTYYYKLEDVDFAGNRTMHGPVFAMPVNPNLEPTTRVTTPDRYSLSQNSPNPFNLDTYIKFAMKESGHVRLSIYNALGRRIRVLVDAELVANEYTVHWDGRDDAGRLVASGNYIYGIECYTSTGTLSFFGGRKMVLLR